MKWGDEFKDWYFECSQRAECGNSELQGECEYGLLFSLGGIDFILGSLIGHIRGGDGWLEHDNNEILIWEST